VSVYKQDSLAGTTIFDEISAKILELSVDVSKTKLALSQQIEKQASDIKNKMFDFKQRLMKVELFKE
jgi:hypothetical protein